MKQTTLSPFLQEKGREIAEKLFPDLMTQDVEFDLPMVIALPCGIHPYNRAAGYFDLVANAIVLYQDGGRQARKEARENIISADTVDIVVHELAHWYQFNQLHYTKTSSVNVHKHPTWTQACFDITDRLFPGEYDIEYFKPAISARIDGKVQKIQREGALTWQQLHHFPTLKLPSFKQALGV